MLAGGLEWDVEQTITHVAGALVKYSVYLASRSTRFLALRIDRWPDATQPELLDVLAGAGAALANVAHAAPSDVRGFHAAGMLDAEGFVALGCLELLVHGHDAATGLGLPYRPRNELCERLLARLFPWVDLNRRPAWPALLRATGRDVDAGAGGDDTWVAQLAPLDEWDGSVPVQGPRPVVEWVLDEGDGKWRPRYWSS